MSDIAEFARNLHEKEAQKYNRELVALSYPSKSQKISDIRAVICDVYGTLVNYWKPGFQNANTRSQTLMTAFKKVAERFGMIDVLKAMNKDDLPEKTLSDFYHGLIALQHEKMARKGVVYPEVKIEEVWNIIIMLLKRRGYKPQEYSAAPEEDLSRYLAFSYNFYSLGRELFDGVVEALSKLKENNIVLGILSNAQFYTPLDLTLLIREQSKGKIDDFNELFEPDLTFFSFEYGVAKPNQVLFRRLYDALYEYQILPSQTVLVGNDLLLDIQPAVEAGMKTALFTGDRDGVFTHDLSDKVIPDISFQSWDQLSALISFYSEEKS
ncbi:MAG TPA: HAD family hydrolase [Chitinispirillaceae bacterium]|nr:HAD family hydrolase [Chitinispirillaceae bacterium]